MTPPSPIPSPSHSLSGLFIFLPSPSLSPILFRNNKHTAGASLCTTSNSDCRSSESSASEFRNYRLTTLFQSSCPVAAGAQTPRRDDVLEWKRRWKNLNAMTDWGSKRTGGYCILRLYLLPFTFWFLFSVPAWVHAYLACTCTYSGYRGQRHVGLMQLREGPGWWELPLEHWSRALIFNSGTCWLQLYSTY
jgi:hypothetical protein